MRAQIGAAGPEAADLLAALHAKAFDSREAWDAVAFASLLAGPGTDAMTAAKSDALLGFILMRTIIDQAEILTLAVLPSARRRGIGRALVAAGIDAARRRGAAHAFLEVSVNNAAAIALYRAGGWTKAGYRAHYYPDGSDALVLSLRL